MAKTKRADAVARRNVALLKRRIEYLEDAVHKAVRRTAEERKTAETRARWMEHEAAALRWAVYVCERWMEEDPEWAHIEGDTWWHLGEAYCEDGQWLVAEKVTKVRPATDAEIEEVLRHGSDYEAAAEVQVRR